jgi:hypothetical protein
MLIENDACYCERCGKPTGALPESRVGEATGHGEPSRACASNATAKNEVDFTTRVAARQVEPLTRGPGRGTRAALYVAVVLVVAGVLASVVMMWTSTQAMQRQQAGQAAERKADWDEMRKLIAETSDEDRRAIYEHINQFVSQSLDEQRKSMMEEYKQFVTQRLLEEHRTFSIETAQAVTQTQKQDKDTFVAVLVTLKSKTRNWAFKSEIDKVIAVYKNKIVGKVRQESADHRVRPTLNKPSGPVRAD